MITNPTFSSIFDQSHRIDKTKRLGTVYNFYRLLIAFLFSTNFWLVTHDNAAKDYWLLINLLPTFGYLLVSIALLVCYYLYPKQSLAMIGLAVDVMVLTIMLYFSGGTDLQVILLFLVAVAASFMLLRSHQAILITLFAITLVIYQQFVNAIKNDLSYITLNNVGLMAVSFISVAYLSHSVARRLTQIENLSQRQNDEVNALNAINEQIVQIIEQGVLVVSHRLEIAIANDTAMEQLQLPVLLESYALPMLVPSLAEVLAPIITHTQDTAIFRLHKLSTADNPHGDTPYAAYVDYRVRISQLNAGHALVLIEDLRREQSHAQQLKLASLGQLTASIAHEIRNPLAAISQASQLLLEEVKETDSHLTEDNGVMYEMIYKQTQRVNQIIEDVLKLSRQQKPNRVYITPSTWLAVFIGEHFAGFDVTLHCHTNAGILFDRHQLEQVLINLVNNGLRFSAKVNPPGKVMITVSAVRRFLYIDVIDTGDGVAKDDIQHLFNPFFTTDHQDTGLGLYLSQAFCQANYAHLQYVPYQATTCFRIICPKQVAYQAV